LNAVLSSLAAFVAALARPRTPLVKAIRLALVIKLFAIGGIAAFMLPMARQHAIDASAVFRLISPATSALNQGER
jgi:hypothetical protein